MATSSKNSKSRSKPKKRPVTSKKVIASGPKSFFSSKIRVFAVILVFGAIGVYLLAQSGALSPDETLLPDQADRGLVYEGKRVKTKGPCAGGFDTTTDEDVKQHGQSIRRCDHLDPSPPGQDIRERIKGVDQDLAALAAYDEKVKPVASEDTSGAQQVPMVDPETVGQGSMDGIGARNVPCFGTGTDGPRVWLLYLYPSGGVNRLADLRAGFRSITERVNSIFYESGYNSGNAHQVRFTTNNGLAGCAARILAVAMPASIMNDATAMANNLNSRGFASNDRKYLSWVDKKYTDAAGNIVKCGQGSLQIDDNPTSANANNTSGGYAWAWKGCWNYAEPHELTHMLGAVQGKWVNPSTGAVRTGSPHSTPGMHCYDGHDVMCYNDGTGYALQNICTNAIAWWRLDCGKNDYFRGNSPASGYLSNHWNTANNRFITR
jgi:hypothetical protein